MHMWRDPRREIPQVGEVDYFSNSLDTKLPLQEAQERGHRGKSAAQHLGDERAERLVEVVEGVPHVQEEDGCLVKVAQGDEQRYQADDDVVLVLARRVVELHVKTAA